MLLHLLQPGSLRPKMARSVFTIFVVSFLFAVLLFTGCKQEPDDPTFELDERLIGLWTDSINLDSYTITSAHLTYTDWSGSIPYAGTIRHAVSSGNAGVLIIEYDNDNKASYPIYDNNWNPTGDYHPLKGNFIGIYYKDLTPNISVKLSGAYIDGGAEEPTLDAAKAAFTLDREGDYVYSYGTYTK